MCFLRENEKCDNDSRSITGIIKVAFQKMEKSDITNSVNNVSTLKPSVTILTWTAPISFTRDRSDTFQMCGTLRSPLHTDNIDGFQAIASTQIHSQHLGPPMVIFSGTFHRCCMVRSLLHTDNIDDFRAVASANTWYGCQALFRGAARSPYQ